MQIAAGKKGVVTEILNGGDIDFAVPINPGDAHVTDMYDGTNFTANPQAAALKAAALALSQKKQVIIQTIQNSADDSILNTALATLDNQYNPQP